jgi:hypothetical protein
MGVSLTSPRQIDHPQRKGFARPQLVAPWGQVTANSTNHSSEGLTPAFEALVRGRTDPHRAFRVPETPAGVAGCGSKPLWICGSKLYGFQTTAGRDPPMPAWCSGLGWQVV